MRQQRIDYTPIARSIPEYSKTDDTLYTCSIGYSSQLGLIRVYPLPITEMKAWDKYEITVEKNVRDNRAESWKLATLSRKDGWVGLSKDCRFIGRVNPETILKTILQGDHIHPISELNARRRSIGIVAMSEYRMYWDVNERFIDSTQTSLFGDVELPDFTNYTKHSKQKKCMIHFFCGGKEHNIQYNEWGVYEFQRKFGADNKLMVSLEGRRHMLIGNMHNHRTNWIGLSLIKNIVAPIQKSAQLTLMDL